MVDVHGPESNGACPRKASQKKDEKKEEKAEEAKEVIIPITVEKREEPMETEVVSTPAAEAHPYSSVHADAVAVAQAAEAATAQLLANVGQLTLSPSKSPTPEAEDWTMVDNTEKQAAAAAAAAAEAAAVANQAAQAAAKSAAELLGARPKQTEVAAPLHPGISLIYSYFNN